MTQQSEREVAADLAHRIRQGDPAAEAQLVERYSRGLYFLLRRITRPPELAEDLHQETFQAALKRLRGKELDEPAKLGEFLRGTARNLVRVEHRRKVRRSAEALDAADVVAERGASPLGHVLLDERLRLVRRLISELRSERDRQLLYRFYIAEEDREDICRDLDLSTAHFNRVLFRARQRFKDLLARFEKRRRFQETSTVHLLVVALLALWPVAAARPLAGHQASTPAAKLHPEVPIERLLSAGEIHRYRYELPAGRPWLVTVEQRGIDVVVSAHGHEGGRLGPVDSPAYRQLAESLLLPVEFLGAEGDAVGHIEVGSRRPRVGSGRYLIRIRELSGATEADRRRLAAETAMTAAARLHFRVVYPEAERDRTAAAALRREAIGRYRAALAHWRALGRTGEQARTLFALAVLVSGLGDPEGALELYTEALELWRQLGEEVNVALALSELGWTQWRLGNQAAAGDRLQEALFLQKKLGNRYGEAVAWNNLCLSAQSRGRLLAARECFGTALELYRELGELGHEAILLSNLGSVYRSMGEPEQSLAHHQTALALRRSTGEKAGEARTLNNLAVLYDELGETQVALDHYGQALEIFRATGERSWEARTLSNLGVAYVDLGEPRRALAFLLRALPLRRRAGDRRGEVATLNHLGHTRSRLGEWAPAEEHHRQALRLAREIDNRREEARALEFLGRARMEFEDYGRARAFFRQALVVVQAMHDRPREAEVLHWKGQAETLSGAPEQALASLHRALELHREVGDLAGESRTLRALARADRQLGRVRSARQRLEAALAILESVRTRVLNPRLRATILASHRGTYELLIDTLMELHGEEPDQGHDRTALEISERARARTLLELLEEADGDFGQADPALLERRRALERRLSAKASRQLDLFSREHTEEERAVLEAERFELTGELENVDAEIRRASPRHPGLNPARTLSSGEVRALLEPGTVLIEIALGETRSFLWWVEADRVESFELAGEETIGVVARRVYEAFSVLDLRAGRSDAEAAAELSHLLLAPVANRLAGQRLVIVADGALHFVPFGALPTPAVESASSPAALLLERHEIVHLPSASVLAVQRLKAAEEPAPRWAAVFADPVFDRSDVRVPPARGSGENGSAGPQPAWSQEALERSIRGLSLSGLGRLPSTRQEAEAIAALAPPLEVLTLLGFAASRLQAFSAELRDYRIVHFATHGLINARDPELSGLVLSRLDQEGGPQNGFLRLPDIYDLDLAAELVVLSGCRTALGQEIRGEGLWGLTRAFLDIGVPRMVASLWRVEDHATAELMARFYRAMRASDRRPAAALRQAQLEILAQPRWRDPYYWAAFLLQGDWR